LAELLCDRKQNIPLAVELVEKDLKLRPGEIKSNEIAAKVYALAGDSQKAEEHERTASRLNLPAQAKSQKPPAARL